MAVTEPVLERALEAAVERHFQLRHEAGLCIPPDEISERSKRIVAHQYRDIVEAALEAVL